jgi:hypothetical protein
MRAIAPPRDDLVKNRTQTVNRLHAVLTHRTPAGAPRGRSADRAAEMLRRVRPREVAGRTHHRLAVYLVAEVRQLDRRIAEATTGIETAVAESGSSLTAMRDQDADRGHDRHTSRIDPSVPVGGPRSPHVPEPPRPRRPPGTSSGTDSPALKTGN